MKNSKTILTVTMIIVMVFLFVGCLMPQPTKGIIEGRVLLPPDASGLSRDVSGWVPVAGAEITIVDANGDSHTAYTDENGYYSFENIEVNSNTVITATVEVNGDTIVLKKVIPVAVDEDENYDAGTMDPESTALALIVEELIDEGDDQEDIDLDEIKESENFEDLLDQVTTAIEEGSDVTDDSDVGDLVGDVTDEYNATTTELDAINIYGTPLVGKRLSIAISPSGSTASVQWQRANIENGSFTNISGATGASYTLEAVDEGKWIRVAAAGTGDYTGTVTSDPAGPVEYPAILSSVTVDSTTASVGYTRFAGNIDVNDNVESGDYDTYYIFEITGGTIEGVPEYYDSGSWLPFVDEGDNKFRFGPASGFDLITVDGSKTEFQIKIIDGDDITGRAYLVDASDDTTVLSNEVEEKVASEPYFPATLSYEESDDTIVGELGYARFAGSIDVEDNVVSGDYDAYYIFEITDGNLEEGTVPQYWDGSAWANFDEVGDSKYRFGPSTGFDLVDVDDTTTEFQVKIDSEELIGKAYLVDANDGETKLSDEVVKTIYPGEVTVGSSEDLQKALDNSDVSKITVTSTGDYQLYNLSELDAFGRTTGVTLLAESETSIRVVYAEGQDLTQVTEAESFKAAKARGAVFRAEETKGDFKTALGSDDGKENMTWDILIRAMYFYKEQAIPLVDALETGTVKTGLSSRISVLKTYYENIVKLDMSGKTESVFDISTGALETFTGLTTLNLSGVGLSETGGLASLTALEELDVTNNNLTELDVLFDPDPKTSLKQLNASNNQLENIIALVQLAQHTSFNADNANWDISNNSMTHEDTEAHIETIQTIFDKATDATFIENWSE